ncbi:MAG: hypothetical protein HC936_04540 [Leptolyngbyaceae cyanobacterium SU_3_3]|nr:hypothetical protein [Leptolyngbyaceae cyanobacterium SU_3_3]
MLSIVRLFAVLTQFRCHASYAKANCDRCPFGPAVGLYTIAYFAFCLAIGVAAPYSDSASRTVAAATAIATPKPKTATAKPPGKPNPTQPAFSTAEVTKLLSQAEDKAIAAANLTQSAQSKEDWALVINQWKRAIAILQPASNANLQRALVQQRLKTYQNNLAAAQQQAKTNPRQLIQRAGGSTKGGIPLIVAPASPDAKPSPTASPTPLPAPPPPPPKS